MVSIGGCSSSAPTAAQRAAEPLLGEPAAPISAKPKFTLTDTAGKPFNFATDTAGQLTLLYFGYTNCPDICQINMAELAAVEARKGVPKAKVVFVTVDPERDTPTVLRKWLDHFNSTFIGLTGTVGQVQTAETAANIPVSLKEPGGAPGVYFMSHTGVVRAYAPNGLGYSLYPYGTKIATYQHDLQVLAARTAAVKHPT